MITKTNTPLNVPFKEKDEAKSLGARWNPAAKHWYIPEGLDASLFAKWLDGAVSNNTNTALQVSKVKELSATLSADADIDDINAMLRDAAEINDDSSL